MNNSETMRRDFIIIGVVILFFLLGFFWWSGVNVDEQTPVGMDNKSVITEKFTISATKVGTHSTVFKKYASGKVEAVLEFEEAIAADDSGNYWASLPANVASTPDSSKLAYIDTQGLKIRSLDDAQDVILVEKLGESRDTIKGYHNWNPSMGNASSIHKPRWSSNGKYISFLIAQYEGSRLGVIDIAERKLTFGPRSGRQTWSRVGNSLLLISSSNDCDGCENKVLVLDAETGKMREMAKEVLRLVEKDYLPE
ncbi:MAG: hypothetical protein AAB364_01330 [Patescibacteria group bacterium]